MSSAESMRGLQALLAKIPKGKVATYKIVAHALSMKSYRAVGQLLKRNPEPDRYPCYKVVASDGSLGGYALGIPEKIKRLKVDGIEIKNGRIVDFERKRFNSKPLDPIL